MTRMSSAPAAARLHHVPHPPPPPARGLLPGGTPAGHGVPTVAPAAGVGRGRVPRGRRRAPQKCSRVRGGVRGAGARDAVPVGALDVVPRLARLLTSMSELTLPATELRRLRHAAMRAKTRTKVGGAGVTREAAGQAGSQERLQRGISLTRRVTHATRRRRGIPHWRSRGSCFPHAITAACKMLDRML
jgi:hypothetical protein